MNGIRRLGGREERTGPSPVDDALTADGISNGPVPSAVQVYTKLRACCYC